MSSFVFRTNQGKSYTANTYLLFGKPAPVTINSVVASASPFIYPVTTADVSGTSITNGINYKVLSFASVSSTTTYTVNYTCANATTIYVLAVGGGGGGGANSGGGGGGGGVVMMPVSLPAGTNQTITVSVGSGGNGDNTNTSTSGSAGNNTTVTFNGANISPALITAIGGGKGGGASYAATSGGSGGGQVSSQAGGTTTRIAPINNNYNYGNFGGQADPSQTPGQFASGGGGGGAGTPGTSPTSINSGWGGSGIQCYLPGITTFTPSTTSYGTYYWGGGGGGWSYYVSGGNGGIGGGGGASTSQQNNATYNGIYVGGSGGAGINNGGTGIANTTGTNLNGGSGGANTGGGGGGGHNSSIAGAGGSGIVIIAFPTVNPVTSNMSAVLPASIVSSGLYSATLNNATLSSLAYNTIKGAYACRLLNYNYFGPIMTLRCSTDICGNYTQNFYSDICGNLGTGYMGTGQSVSTWLSGQAANTTYAYVTKWYGQGMDVSFNSATQYITTAQPIYDVSNGLLNYGYTGAGGGVSAPQTNCYLNLPNGALPYNDASYSFTFRHWNIPTTGNFGFINGGLNNANANCLCIRTNSNAYFEYWGNYNFSVSSSIVPNNVISSTYVSSSSQQPFYVNSSLITTGTMASPRTQVNTSNFIGVTNTSTTSPGSEYNNGQFYNMYIFNSSLGTTDRQIVEATPYQYSFPPVIAGLSASQVTSTTFVLGWSTVSSAQTYALWINGSYFATYNAPALTTGTVTPSTSGPWTLNLYAYNASNVLLATGSTGAVLMAVAFLSANTGATQTTNGSNTVFTFTSSGTFTVATTGYASVLIVGGGGGGGYNYGGGGGAGGLVYFDANYKPMLLTAGTSYTVTVGTGGVGSGGTNTFGTNGLDSTFNGYIAKGGGGGSYNNGSNATVAGAAGGCGGGSNNIAIVNGSTQPFYANAFYIGGYSGGQGSSVNQVSGGGGGTGGPGGAPTSSGTVGGVGGPGYSCNIIGTPTYYGGGGGGGAFQFTGGSGGLGGGGNGGYNYYNGTTYTGFAGSNGTANTGGGGGSSSSNGIGYTGGSGVVIISCQGVPNIAGFAATSVTATNFVLSWTAVTNAASYILNINGTNFATYGAVTTTGTVTPGVSGGFWTLILYAYSASNVLLARGVLNPANIVSTTNLIGYYPLDTDFKNYALGTPAVDGTANNCSINSFSKLGSGSAYCPQGGVYTLPYVVSSPTTTTGQFSTCAWFYPNSSNTTTISFINMGDTNHSINGASYFNIFSNSPPTALQTYISMAGTNGPLSPNVPFSLNAWCHVGFTIQYNSASSTQICIYMNGSNVSTFNVTNYLNNYTYYPSFGTSPQNFLGYIDDIRLYNRVLSPIEFALIYSNAVR